MGKFLNILLVLTLFFTCLVDIPPALANTITNDGQVPDSLADIPPPELVGWFLTYNPANEWTSLENIATLESWLLVVEEISLNSALAGQYYLAGINDANETATYQILMSAYQTQQDPVPEPATLGLLGGSLAILLLYTGLRLRKMTAGSTYGPLRRTDRPNRH